MNIVFFGYDYTLDIAQRLVSDGHVLSHIYTFPCDNIYAFNCEIHNYAHTHHIPITESSITKGDVYRLCSEGVDAFLSTSYPYKIPEIDENKAYGINFHPTYLPKGRGVMPLPHIIMKQPNAAGFTLHKLADDFDAGDVLFQEYMPIDMHTDIETLSARIALRVPDIISDVISNIDEYWNAATSQNVENASYYHAPTAHMRMINFDDDIDKLLRLSKAFGRYGVTASFTSLSGKQRQVAVFNFSGWKEKHSYNSGTVMREHPREIVISVTNGYIVAKEFVDI